jgi:hypothetical protein
MSATSALGNREVIVGHPLSTPIVATTPWNAGRSRSSLLGVCFVAEDPKEREHLRKILSEATPKLLLIELRHSDISQDKGANRL